MRAICSLLCLSFLLAPLFSDDSVSQSTVDKPLIVFGADNAYPPLSYKKGLENEGIDILLIQAICNRLGARSSIVLDTWSSVLDALKEGTVDAVSGILYTEERTRYYDFSIPYIYDVYSLFMHKDAELRSVQDLIGKRLAILRDDAAIETFVTPNNLSQSIVRTDSYLEALRMVAEGKSDYTIAPLTLGTIELERMGIENVIPQGRPLFPVEYRFAVKKGNTQLLYQINNALSRLQEDGVLGNLERFKPRTSPFTKSLAERPSLLMPLIIFFIVVLVSGFALWGLLFKRELEKRTAKLSGRIDEYQAVLDRLPFPISWKTVQSGLRGANIAFTSLEKATVGVKEFSPEERRALDSGESICGLDYQYKTPQGAPEQWGRKLAYPCVLQGQPGLVSIEENRTELVLANKHTNQVLNELADKNSQLSLVMGRDTLTGLLSRQGILKVLAEELERKHRYGTSLAVLLVHFKELGAINKIDGYDSGDTVLQLAGEALCKSIRHLDTPGRFSGTLFLLVLPHTSAEAAKAVQEKFLSSYTQLLQNANLSAVEPFTSVVDYSGQDIPALIDSLEY